MIHQEEYQKRLDKLEVDGLKRSIFVKEKNDLINLSSNDYLGLSHHPAVIAAAAKVAQDWGVGGTSSRLLAGTFEPHISLEKDLASFLDKEAALVFASGYHVNTGLLPALTTAEDIIFVDKLCHASIIDGIRLSAARFCTFDHNDADHLTSLLRKRRGSYKGAYIVTEGIFSMDGDHSILPEIIFLAKQHNTVVYLDEAHSFGLFGPEGRGYAAKLGLLKDIDIFVGTLSKTLGSQGGFVACNKTIADLLVSKARSFIYTTALSPVMAASAKAALQLLPDFEAQRFEIAEASKKLRSTLNAQGFQTLTSQSQIIPILTGEVEATKKLSDHLLAGGYFVPSIRPPTVPQGMARVRLSITHGAVQSGLTKLENLFAAYQQKSPTPGEVIVKSK